MHDDGNYVFIEFLMLFRVGDAVAAVGGAAVTAVDSVTAAVAAVADADSVAPVDGAAVAADL